MAATRWVPEQPINSYVLAKYENKKPSKFHTNLHGPYRIISKQRAVYTIYTVENLVTHQPTTTRRLGVDFHVQVCYENSDLTLKIKKHQKSLLDMTLNSLNTEELKKF